MTKNELIKILKCSKDEFCEELYEFIKGNLKAKESVDSLMFIRFVVLIEEYIKVDFEDDKLSLSSFGNADDLLYYITSLENASYEKSSLNGNFQE